MSGPAYSGFPRGCDGRCIIEILGPPGAGKSSLAGALESRGDEVRLVRTYWSRSNLLPWVRSGTSLLPLLLCGSFSGPSPIRERVWTVRVSASHEIVERESESARVLLLDQGPLFTMMRLLEAADVRGRGPRWERWWGQELTAWAAALDITVVLDAPDDILLERIRGRGKPHQLKDLPEPDARKAFGRWRALLEDLIAELQTHGDVEILRLDTGGKPVVEVAAGTMRPLGLEVAPGVGE